MGVGFYIIGLLFFGSLNTLTTKVQFQIKSVGRDGEEKYFQKPWFEAIVMFLGMTTIIFFYWYKLSKQKPTNPDALSQGLIDGEQKKPSAWKVSLYIIAPAACDLLASCLCFIGLLYTTASVWQMLRGSMIVFSAILSVIFLKRKLYAFHWVGVSLCSAAIVMVGFASMKSDNGMPEEEFSQEVMGMGLIIIGQLIQASQIILEEALLKNISVDPLQIVGMEGVWGSILLVFVGMPLLYWLPGKDGGHVEDSIDTLIMIKNSTTLQAIIFFYWVSILTYNVSGMMVTQSLSGVVRCMLEAARTACIWLVDLFVFYYITPNFGEHWDNWSYLQLFGFVTLVTGTAIYSNVIQLPGFEYPASVAAQHKVDESKFVSPSLVLMMSPNLPPKKPKTDYQSLSADHDTPTVEFYSVSVPGKDKGNRDF
eukprot:GILJ01001205.1.p1 GENE.GILJ01001205.1~~GILJ01001205.1.p1  ORF type:complete len:423 (-),score=79.83 GILJ01001205.1:132-1400(-)